MKTIRTGGLLALALLVSGCQVNDGPPVYGYPGGGYGGYRGYSGYTGGYRGGYYPRESPYYDRGYSRGYRSAAPYDGHRQPSAAPPRNEGRAPPSQGGRPPLVGLDGRINPGGYR